MRNRKREIDSLADFRRQLTEYFDPWHMMSEPVVLGGYCKEHFVMYDAEADRIQQEMFRAGLKEVRAALFDVAANDTERAGGEPARVDDISRRVYPAESVGSVSAITSSSS